MKLFLLCAVIFILLFAICILSTATVKNITTHTEASLLQALEHYRAEQKPEGYKQILHADSFWDKHNNILGMLLYHSEIDEVTAELAMLKAYAIAGNSEEIFCSCAELFTLLEQIREMERPYLKNIL